MECQITEDEAPASAFMVTEQFDKKRQDTEGHVTFLIDVTSLSVPFHFFFASQDHYN